ncbi:MAG TPA: FAD-dependent oxidoreductase [Epulopiscium sp.]|nr:FAD-dependent oxidoreductase [Candidatus Epulonipiscium sp.]
MTTATTEKIQKGNFDHVVIATGSESFLPQVKGINSENVYISTDVLIDEVKIDKENVTVIGGGLVGCETALYLANQGKNVTLIEMLEDIMLMAEHSVNNDLSLRHLLAKNNVDIKVNTKLESIEDGKIVINNAGTPSEILCDAVVIASGYKSDHSLSKSLDGIVEYTIIGDNLKARNILDAVHEGFNIARTI